MLPSGTNFDNLIDPGTYRYSSDLNHQGQPETLNYWNVEVMAYDNNNVMQRWSSVQSKDVIYFRRRLTNWMATV